MFLDDKIFKSSEIAAKTYISYFRFQSSLDLQSL